MNFISKQIIECFSRGGKLLILGCGGSNAEASHMAAEFIGKGFPAIALNDPSIITALANDFSFEEVFCRWIFALGKQGDIVITLSTSGRSKSVLNAMDAANRMGLDIIDWPRKKQKKNDYDTAWIQEYQLELIHTVYLEVDKYFKNENNR